jgi:hypothetical protein
MQPNAASTWIRMLGSGLEGRLESGGHSRQQAMPRPGRRQGRGGTVLLNRHFDRCVMHQAEHHVSLGGSQNLTPVRQGSGNVV